MSVDLSVLPKNLAEVAKGLEHKYLFSKAITKGANGYILVGKNRVTDQNIVVKFYYWGDGAHLEPKHLCYFNSPHILDVYDAVAIDTKDAYFVTPYCEEGDLDQYIQNGGIGVRRAVDIILEVASGANAIHAKGFIHRDLKPSNIFCRANQTFVIGDFGSVVRNGEEGFVTTGSKHSLIYRTPEEVSSCRAYPQGDVYQIGIILYQLLGGSLHYEEQKWLSDKELFIYNGKEFPDNQLYATSIIERKITSGKLLNFSSLPAWCPPQLVKIVRKCCKVNHRERFMSISDLMVKLNNLRSSLPDWRLEPEPVLYRHPRKFKIIESGGQYRIEKKATEHSAWRKYNEHQEMSLAEAVKRVERM